MHRRQFVIPDKRKPLVKKYSRCPRLAVLHQLQSCCRVVVHGIDENLEVRKCERVAVSIVQVAKSNFNNALQ